MWSRYVKRNRRSKKKRAAFKANPAAFAGIC
jgi:hypothetical protein